MRNEKLYYDDYVFIIKGEHKGKFGFYDDDYECGSKKIIVVIDENTWDYVVVLRTSVIKMQRDFLQGFINTLVENHVESHVAYKKLVDTSKDSNSNVQN